MSQSPFVSAVPHLSNAVKAQAIYQTASRNMGPVSMANGYGIMPSGGHMVSGGGFGSFLRGLGHGISTVWRGFLGGVRDVGNTVAGLAGNAANVAQSVGNTVQSVAPIAAAAAPFLL